MRTITKIAAFTLGAGVALGLALSSPLMASATEAPDTVEVWWLMPDHGTPDNVTWDQPHLPDEEAGLLPGECAQIDLYLVHEAAIFTADGILRHGEDYQNEHQRGAISWRFVCAPNAIQPPDESTPGSAEVVDCEASLVTISNWHDVVAYVGDKYGYTAQPPVRVDDEPSTRPATEIDCPPVVVPPTPAIPVASTVPTLPVAGPEDAIPGLLFGAGTLALGIAMVIRRKVLGRV